MARKVKAKGRLAARLPTGKYAWKGRAVPFGKLPKSEQFRFRSLWATRSYEERLKAQRAERAFFEPSKVIVSWVWTDNKDGRIYTGLREPGMKLRTVIRAVRDYQQKNFNEEKIGIWRFVISWPKDPRGTKRRPWQSIAGQKAQPLTRLGEKRAGDYALAIEKYGSKLLKDRIKSGGTGPAVIALVQLMSWVGGKRVPFPKVEEDRKRSKRRKKRKARK